MIEGVARYVAAVEETKEESVREGGAGERQKRKKKKFPQGGNWKLAGAHKLLPFRFGEPPCCVRTTKGEVLSENQSQCYY